MEKPEKPVSKFDKKGTVKMVKSNILKPESNGLIMIMTAVAEDLKVESDLHNLLEKKWLNVKKELKGWRQYNIDYKLGNVKHIAVNSDVWLSHCLFVNKEGKADPKAMETCIKKLGENALWEKASVHVSGLLTEQFPQLGELCQKYLVDKGVSVYFYAK